MAYGARAVLEDFSHVFADGTVTCVMGPSGCGKTTLLRLAAGLETPVTGEILGRPGGGIAMAFQEDRLPPQLTASGCLRCVLPRRPGRDERIRALLADLGLGEAVDRPVRELSGGMLRRVALARALLYPSPLLLLDEPFTGLDAATKDAVMAASRPLIEGRTTLLATHDETDADRLNAATLVLKQRTLND